MTDRGCGAIGCREDAYAVIDHPRHGRRTVCKSHAEPYPVEEVLAADA